MELSLESAGSQYKEVERVPCKLTGLPGDLVEGRSRGRDISYVPSVGDLLMP